MNRLRIARISGVSLLAAILAQAGFLSAEVVRMEIQRREPFAGGHAFGSSGPYEKVVGRLYLEVSPDDPANQMVRDLKLAPRNARGRVEFWTDFFLLRPKDPNRGNRRLLYDVNNRGNKLAVWTFNDGSFQNDPSTLADAGNGFLMRQGYSVLWCGWNGDVVQDDKKRLLLGVPVARENGQTITGKIYVEICRDETALSQPLAWSPWGVPAAYAAVDVNDPSATLSMRPSRAEPAVDIPRDRWAFARWENGRVVPDPRSVYVKDGFRPGWLYDLVYTGKDPRVSGLGLAAVRDCVSFFRYAAADQKGTPNPAANALERAYIFGISQSGRFVHHFFYEGFNADESNRTVFDGAIAHVPGSGRGFFNCRFLQATSHGSQHEDNLSPSDAFPFNFTPQTDPVTGQRGDMLARARAGGHVPKLMVVQTSTEYWTRAASLLHTDVGGTRDADLGENVRLYLVAGAQHLGGGPPTRGIYQNVQNPLKDRGPVLRAMLVALDRWVSAGREPPESRYPKIADKTLVDVATYGRQFPRIPGVRLPQTLYTPLRLDMGPRWASEGVADLVPPKVGRPYRTLVPAVDADGNDVAGIRLPDVAVPVGTYVGWNLRGAACGAEGMLARWTGSYFPFAVTAEARLASGDPRLAVRERYPTRAAYLERIARIAAQLHRDGFLLEEDVAQPAAERRDLW